MFLTRFRSTYFMKKGALNNAHAHKSAQATLNTIKIYMQANQQQHFKWFS
jgi:hypothetical protein